MLTTIKSSKIICDCFNCHIINHYLLSVGEVILPYRNASNKRPGHLLNFCDFKGGVYSRGAFKRRGRLLIFLVYQAVPFILDKDPFVKVRVKENATNILTFHRKLENELMKRKQKSQNVTLKFRKKGVYRKFPFYSAK